MKKILIIIFIILLTGCEANSEKEREYKVDLQYIKKQKENMNYEEYEYEYKKDDKKYYITSERVDSDIYNYLKVISKDENDSTIWEYKASNYEIDKYVYMNVEYFKNLIILKIDNKVIALNYDDGTILWIKNNVVGEKINLKEIGDKLIIYGNSILFEVVDSKNGKIIFNKNEEIYYNTTKITVESKQSFLVYCSKKEQKENRTIITPVVLYVDLKDNSVKEI